MALIVAYVITVLALFGIAFVMLKLQPDAGTTELLILAVYVLSCFAGGWYAGRRAGQRKLFTNWKRLSCREGNCHSW